MAQRRKSKDGRLSKRRLRRRRRRQMIACLVFACVVLVLGIINLVLYKAVSKYPENTICKNVYIGSVDVSGMSRKEAKKALEKQLEADKILALDVKVDEQYGSATFEEYGLSYKNIQKTVDKAVDYGKKGSYWSRYWKLRKTKKKRVVIEAGLAVDQEAGKAVFAERVEPLAQHARNATISVNGDELTVEKEQEGEKVDTSASLKKINEYLNDGWDHKAFSMKAVLKEEKPTVVAKDLESIQDELGGFSTDAGGGERVQNLQTGASKINGIVLMPGEEVSVCDRMVPFTAENGYVPGGTYVDGEVVESYGGGICQVSTTLYNAVLYAELEVVERYPHSMTVSYVKPSRDAAIAEGLLDFKFKNNYDTPIYVYCEINGANELVCKIYGKDTRPEGRTVEYESEVISTEEAGVVYKANSERWIGYIEATSSAYAGMEARLWKVVYEDGEEVSRDVCNTSSYKKKDAVVEVGVKSDSANATALVQNAIATQDKSTIYNAVSEAGGMG